MDWNGLLSSRKLRRSEGKSGRGRSPFQQDADLVVFSAAFRRLQDKTQVQPLSEGGQVRTRLTHSIEVASVGRSLGTQVAETLEPRRGLDAEQKHAIAHIVHAACLAHDIGNPPFGHGGEDAIQAFFRRETELTSSLSVEEREDLLAFDGNAQGLRTLTQLENYRFDGGLRLTHATLGAFMKYVVRAADRVPGGAIVGATKPGYFLSEQRYVQELRADLGLPDGVRHPLVYLTEAADDICYAIVDLEDGHDAGLVDHRDVAEVLCEIADQPLDPRLGRNQQLHKLRGLAIGRLVDAAAQGFLDVEPGLLRGESSRELLGMTAFGPSIARAKALAATHIFAAQPVVERLIGGQRVLSSLLGQLSTLVPALEGAGFSPSALRGEAVALFRLMGELYAPTTRYEALLGVTDFVCGLTDRAAINLHRKLSGLSL
jgi:dGTPase